MDIYQHIFENVPDALLLVDMNGRIVNINVQAEVIFGYSRKELVGGLIELLIPDRLASMHVKHRENFSEEPTVRRMGSRRREMLARRKSGSEFAADIMISPLHTDSAAYVLCAVRDITDHVATIDHLRRHSTEMTLVHERLTYLASRDGLTELLNRRVFQEQVEWLLRNAARRGESISLIMIDLDFFKRINDQFGHIEGDHVLQAVAGALQRSCRQNDIAARYGGEEFVVALPDTHELGCVIAAENFRSAIAALDNPRAPITASVGAVTYSPSPTSAATPLLFEMLVNEADRALYAAKNAGRNCVRHVNALVSRGQQ
jgi:diguanylate cyclase (GGDEF)-like protein/PAS domain S-box-containing protein